jgi:hypothetical protein
MNLIKTINIEIKRKTTEHNLSLIFFSFLFLFALNKEMIGLLTFFLAYWVFPEEIVKGKISYLLKLPYRKLNLFISNYLFGVIIGLIPMLIVMVFFGFNLQRIVIFLTFYTSIFAIQSALAVFISKGSLVLFISLIILIIGKIIYYENGVYYSFSLIHMLILLLNVVGLFLLSYIIFKRFYLRS